MGTTLTGTKPKDTYDSLIKVGDNGPIGATVKTLSDGLGNDLPISVSTTNVGIGTSSPASKLAVQGEIRSNDSGGYAALLASSALGYSIVADTHTSGGIAMFTEGSERARFTANGLTFNGDTAAANALDDYEEGTWTPVITDGTNDATMIAGNGGVYTKIGRQVTAHAYCRTTSLGSVSGIVFVKGLPFASLNSLQSIGSVTFGYYTGMNLASGQSVGGFIGSNATRITLTLNDSASGTTELQASEWTSLGYLHLTITYFV